MTARGSLHRDEGSVTLWVLGLALTVLFVGGLSLDLWRAFSARRAMAGAVDAAAQAGASGVDEDAFRESGQVRLDEVRARALAWESLERQPDKPGLVGAEVQVRPDGSEILVRAFGEVHLTLLRLFLADAPLVVRVTATSAPRGR